MLTGGLFYYELRPVIPDKIFRQSVEKSIFFLGKLDNKGYNFVTFIELCFFILYIKIT